MSTECIQAELDLGRSGGRKLVGACDSGAITSNGGVVLLAAADCAIGLSRRLVGCFTDLHFGPLSVIRCPTCCASASSASRSATRT